MNVQFKSAVEGRTVRVISRPEKSAARTNASHTGMMWFDFENGLTVQILTEEMELNSGNGYFQRTEVNIMDREHDNESVTSYVLKNAKYKVYGALFTHAEPEQIADAMSRAARCKRSWLKKQRGY